MRFAARIDRPALDDGPRVIEIHDNEPPQPERPNLQAPHPARQPPPEPNEPEPERRFIHPITVPNTIAFHPEFQPRPAHLNPHYVPEPDPKPQTDFKFIGPILSFEHGPRIVDFPNLKDSRTGRVRLNQQRLGANLQRPRQNQQRTGPNSNGQRTRPNQQRGGPNQRSRPTQQRASHNQRRPQGNQQRSDQNQQHTRPNRQLTSPNQERTQPNRQPLGPNQQASHNPEQKFVHPVTVPETIASDPDIPNAKEADSPATPKRKETHEYIDLRNAIDADILRIFFSKLPLKICTQSTLHVMHVFLSGHSEEFCKLMHYVEREEEDRSYILDLPLDPQHGQEEMHLAQITRLQFAINLLPIARPLFDLRTVLTRFSELRRIQALSSQSREQFSRILDFTDDSNVTIEKTNYFQRVDAGSPYSQHLYQAWMMVLPTRAREDVHRLQEQNPDRPMIVDMSSEPFFTHYNQRLIENIISNPSLLLHMLQEIQNRARRME